MLIKLVFIFFMTLFGAIASLFLKKAASSKSIFELVMNYNLYLGGGLYVTAAILNIIVLRSLDYSVVVPLTSLTYVWTMITSKLFLNEQITKRKIAGIFFIIIGVFLTSI